MQPERHLSHLVPVAHDCLPLQDASRFPQPFQTVVALRPTQAPHPLHTLAHGLKLTRSRKPWVPSPPHLHRQAGITPASTDESRQHPLQLLHEWNPTLWCAFSHYVVTSVTITSPEPEPVIAEM